MKSFWKQHDIKYIDENERNRYVTAFDTDNFVFVVDYTYKDIPMFKATVRRIHKYTTEKTIWNFNIPISNLKIAYINFGYDKYKDLPFVLINGNIWFFPGGNKIRGNKDFLITGSSPFNHHIQNKTLTLAYYNKIIKQYELEDGDIRYHFDTEKDYIAIFNEKNYKIKIYSPEKEPIMFQTPFSKGTVNDFKIVKPEKDSIYTCSISTKEQGSIHYEPTGANMKTYICRGNKILSELDYCSTTISERYVIAEYKKFVKDEDAVRNVEKVEETIYNVYDIGNNKLRKIKSDSTSTNYTYFKIMKDYAVEVSKTKGYFNGYKFTVINPSNFQRNQILQEISNIRMTEGYFIFPIKNTNDFFVVLDVLQTIVIDKYTERSEY